MFQLNDIVRVGSQSSCFATDMAQGYILDLQNLPISGCSYGAVPCINGSNVVVPSQSAGLS